MFFGMSLCFIPHLILTWNKNRANIRENESFNMNLNERYKPFIFLPAAMFDLISTCFLYFALILTYSSSFQMLMGI